MTKSGRSWRVLAVALLAIAAVPCSPAFSRGSHSGGTPNQASHSTRGYTTSRGSHPGSRSQSTYHSASSHDGGEKAVAGVKRDSHRKIARSGEAKSEFKKSHPCPSTGRSTGACSGYVIDHVNPLKRGGADSPNNMQWQTKDAAKAKDKTE